MSRLESEMSAGFFATPKRVFEAIASHLAPGPGGGRRIIRLLDPCSGTGEPARCIAEALGAETFAIEINEERAGASRTRLSHVLNTSAFSVRLANGAFSLLYLNPPYADDDEKRRLEHAFLTCMTRSLCIGGLLVFVVPQRRLPISSRYLASHYAGFLPYRFPDPEFAAFRQMVLFAHRKPQSPPDEAVRTQLDAWGAVDLPPLPDLPDGPPIGMPSLPAGEVLFASLHFDALVAAEEARRRGVWTQPQLAEQLWPPDERPVRPLMPLRKGHLALLIAAGMLNNIALDQDGQRILVKGRTYKEVLPVESEDEDVEVTREVLRTSVTVLHLSSGVIEVVGEESSTSAMEQPAA